MYNGVGLQTPRGSGTSGHVQASKFLVKPRSSSSAAADGAGAIADYGTRKPNKDILEHDRKRQMELRLLEQRDALEEQGYTEGKIEERVAEARKTAEIEAEPLSSEGYGLCYKPLRYLIISVCFGCICVELHSVLQRLAWF
jgi:hypothetical protein